MRCVSSWSRRSTFAWPRSLNDALSAARALAAACSSLIAIEAQPAPTIPITASATIVFFFMAPPSAFDRRRVEDAAVRVLREEHRKGDRRRGNEFQLGEALLAEAVVEAPLHRAHFALRDAIGRPRAVGLLRVLLLQQVRQVLEANALVVVAVTARACEVVGAAAEEENLLADLVGLDFPRMIRRDVHLHAARLTGAVRDQRIHRDLLARVPERILLRLLGCEALERDHASHQPRLEILDLVGIREVLGK